MKKCGASLNLKKKIDSPQLPFRITAKRENKQSLLQDHFDTLPNCLIIDLGSVIHIRSQICALQQTNHPHSSSEK